METNNQQQVEASKQFAVPVEKLYEAWNDPEQLKQWWRPLGNHLKEVTNELKSGGTVTYLFNDNALVISGTYDEVRPNEKLVYSWNWEFPENAVKNASYKLTILFTGQQNGSQIQVLQETVKSDEMLHPKEEGWEKGLADLADFLSGNATNAADNQAQQNANDEEPGYRERPEQQKVGGG
ncbi:MAG TPA: SRPBCC family protein [Segetibacter sp.]|nr:SRPBCC family protein [Segetibacter sp.]